MLPCREVEDHLKKVHESFVCRTEASGEIKGIYWHELYKLKGTPLIAKVGGRTFFLTCISRERSHFFWITILGSEEDAQKYEVKMTAAPKGDTTITARKKVYSTDMSKEDILKDSSGILKICKDLAESLSLRDGNLVIYMDYHIIRK